MTDDVLRCDVAVIGAGTAGLAAERAARSSGATTLLIDPEFNGSTCARVGCMPSKLLIAASSAAHAARTTDQFGVRTGDVSIDGAAVMQRVRAERDRFARLTRENAIDDLPEDIKIRDCARFLGPDTLALGDGRTIAAKSIIIATGSSPAIPDQYAALGELALTTEMIFEIDDLPNSLAVIGGGSIGLELAQAFARLGVTVSLFDRSDRLNAVRCDKVHDAVQTAIRGELSVHLGVELEAEAIEDAVKISWVGNSNGDAMFDRVLVAVGRPPMFDGLDLERAGLDLDEDGVPVHDRQTMRCGDSAIFLAGDAAADLPVLHEASHDGSIAGRNAAAFPEKLPDDRTVRFTLTFTDPPLASIGQADGEGITAAHADYSNQGRARVDGVNHGLVTLYANAADGVLVGADICAPGGDHLAHLLVWAIERGETATTLLQLPFYHPTLEEGLKGALQAICDASSIDAPQNRDTGSPSGA